MKTNFRIASLLSAALIVSCGTSLTDAEKQTAGHAVASIMSSSNGPTSRHALAVYQHARAASSTCTPSAGSTQDGITSTISCPDANTWKITMTSTETLSRSCGTDTFTIQALTASFTFSSSGSGVSIGADVNASVNANPLVCKFSATIDTNAGSATVGGEGYSCTYKGADLSQTDLSGIRCS